MFTSSARPNDAPRILVVDDIADNRDLLQLLLEGEGYQVDTAAGGYCAIAKMEQQPPDLVLLDVMMPDLDGYSVAHWMAEQHLSVPVLFVTGCADIAVRSHETALTTDWIRKPIAFEELLDKTRAFVAAL